MWRGGRCGFEATVSITEKGDERKEEKNSMRPMAMACAVSGEGANLLTFYENTAEQSRRTEKHMRGGTLMTHEEFGKAGPGASKSYMQRTGKDSKDYLGGVAGPRKNYANCQWPKPTGDQKKLTET